MASVRYLRRTAKFADSLLQLRSVSQPHPLSRAIAPTACLTKIDSWQQPRVYKKQQKAKLFIAAA